jgi:hypothetical protein
MADPRVCLYKKFQASLLVWFNPIGFTRTSFTNMSRSPGCQASPLINAIFYRLPYFTSGLTTNASVENILDDFVVRNLDVCILLLTFLWPYYIMCYWIWRLVYKFVCCFYGKQRAAGWAGIILCMVIVLSICTCFYCCCTSFLCCVRGREKPLALKLLLGVITGAIIIVGMWV